MIFLRLSRPRRSWTGAIGLLLLGAGISMFALSHRSDSAAETEIRAVLQKWTDDFNSGKSAVVCDLYSQRLIMEFQGSPERNFEQQCQILQEFLGGGPPTARFFPTIKDVVARRDYAVVRVNWTATTPVSGDAGSQITQTASLDIFHLESDRRWRMVRSLGFQGAAHVVTGQVNP